LTSFWPTRPLERGELLADGGLAEYPGDEGTVEGRFFGQGLQRGEMANLDSPPGAACVVGHSGSFGSRARRRRLDADRLIATRAAER
jgi:hypothetical protein